MVSERDASTATDDGVTDGVAVDGGSTATDSRDDATYDVVYRATRDAMWDVVGTAVLVLFYVALGFVGLSVAWTGLGFGVNPFALGIGLIGLLVGLVAASRVYVLATE
ncbi:hypothetical protein C474_11126 [Halogeometricum pallidum JCM 14848]|uniref:Uncharacterized protein n=1 Tax=Halogeometricum pallidum JCM 14848 TaxID=1227487 RepID=M0D6D6_HALPD|nr:hypothetical protein [Halogeometricum pallidum]ELZ31010.1 hypothetical protein C474_11126 [Halogeometricum pallidum JCM 14848]